MRFSSKNSNSLNIAIKREHQLHPIAKQTCESKSRCARRCQLLGRLDFNEAYCFAHFNQASKYGCSLAFAVKVLRDREEIGKFRKPSWYSPKFTITPWHHMLHVASLVSHCEGSRLGNLSGMEWLTWKLEPKTGCRKANHCMHRTGRVSAHHNAAAITLQIY